MVKGKYINEEARKAYKKAEKKIKAKAEGPLSEYKTDPHTKYIESWMTSIQTDMLKIIEEVDKMKMSVRVLATRLNRVDGIGK